MQSPITLEALLVLDTIDKRGSFAAAAEQLNKLPSALSYIVQKLEEQLGVSLFIRQGRRSVLTPAGQHLMHEGRKLLAATDKISEQTKTIAHGWEPKIKIAVDSIFDTRPLFSILNTFLTEHPNIEIDLTEEVMNGCWEALIEDNVDILIGAPSPIPSHQGIRAVPLYQLENMLVAAPTHPICKITHPITQTDIEHFRTIIVHDSAHQAIPWSSNIIEQASHFYVSSIEQKIAAITAGIGVGFLPPERIENQLKHAKLIPIQTHTKTKQIELYMAWKIVNKGKGLQRLRQLIEASFER